MRTLNFYRYFLALLPSAEARRKLSGIQSRIPLRSVVRDGHFHMTLALLDEARERNSELANEVDAAMRGHSLEQCDVWLPQLVVEPGIALLKTVGRQPHLKRLRRDLLRQLGSQDIALLRGKTFNPHTTLGYDPIVKCDGVSLSRSFVGPVFWRAFEIVLIESWVGQTRHEILGRWPLLAPAQGELDLVPRSPLVGGACADGEGVDLVFEQFS